MTQSVLGAAGLLLCLIHLPVQNPAPGHYAQDAASFNRGSPTHSSIGAAPDTIRASGRVGLPLILSLPARLADNPVTRYTTLQGPALSGVAGRSFTWITKDARPGTSDVHLKAHHPDAPPDTLVLRIRLESS